MFEFSIETFFQLPSDPALYMTTISIMLSLSVTLSAAVFLNQLSNYMSESNSSIWSEVPLQSQGITLLNEHHRSFISWAAMTIRRKDAPDDGKDDHHFLF